VSLEFLHRTKVANYPQDWLCDAPVQCPLQLCA
jgi:hypothetical protein